MNEFIIAGTGGQGVITCSRLILETAMEKGLEVRSAETIGMAQRGGSVMSHVRIGEQIHSPFIPVGKADEVISMDLAEAVRNQRYLKGSGIAQAPDDSERAALLSENRIRSDISLNCYDLENQWKKNGIKRNTNIIMLGIVFSGGRHLISEKDIEKILIKRYSGEIRKKMLEALALGAELSRKGKRIT
ncbi:pyruvate ferredoxin oxidoreductase [Lacrimispora amygdalina]|uniref:Pyruvate ferredoxin oxidoreductase n=1 Tax=Lacrimispora amygdalina TaxID=253257 RepID=A0A3E2N828_9FIRM|nr:2-oxoacid:acceptor oxidoreductase family protein [Clostridium indicum]RFZ77167.1 pyruvate ferredoxin oxidoreductase [Clostridium indicum]